MQIEMVLIKKKHRGEKEYKFYLQILFYRGKMLEGREYQLCRLGMILLGIDNGHTSF